MNNLLALIFDTEKDQVSVIGFCNEGTVDEMEEKFDTRTRHFYTLEKDSVTEFESIEEARFFLEKKNRQYLDFVCNPSIELDEILNDSYNEGDCLLNLMEADKTLSLEYGALIEYSDSFNREAELETQSDEEHRYWSRL